MVINVLGQEEILEMKFSSRYEGNNRNMIETECDTLKF